MATDICNMRSIYDQAGNFEYFLPQYILKSYLSGDSFDYKTPYTQEEFTQLCADINTLFHKTLSTHPVKEHSAIITAGAPGSGKTTKVDQELKENALEGFCIVHVCPDATCLPNLTGYKNDIAQANGSKEALLAAYTKWRPASNAAAHLILANLIRLGYAFYFGTTSSGFSASKLYAFLKEKGYNIRVIHMTASNGVRWESIKERDKSFVQTTEQDVVEKGRILPQRILDTFLAHADEVEFYYRSGVKKDADLAAKWTRNEQTEEKLGTLDIISPAPYGEIKSIHNAAAAPHLQWERAVEKNSEIVWSFMNNL
jgi:predicted ABC-type ATPase